MKQPNVKQPGTIKRADFVDVLNKVNPAVALKDLIPIHACFCFDGKSVTAYDDIVSLRYPCETEIVGGLRGSVLLPLLSASKAAELTLTQAGTDVIVKAGRSKLKMPLLDSAQFLFVQPPDVGAQFMEIEDSFIEALKLVSISMDDNPPNPWRFGVTVQVTEGENTILNTSDNKRASRMLVEGIFGLTAGAIILPPRFVRQLTASYKAESVGEVEAQNLIYFHPEWVRVDFKSGLVLFSSLKKDAADSTLYNQIFEQADSLAESLLVIPKEFEQCLARATIIAGFAEAPATVFTVKGGQLSLQTDSSAGQANDTLVLAGHEDIVVKAPPSLIKEALAPSSQIGFTKSFVLLAGGNFTHLVSTITTVEASNG